MVRVKYDPADVPEPVTVLDKIKREIDQRNYIHALFLEASALESYLSSLIRVTGLVSKKLPKKVESAYNRMSFNNLLAVNVVLGNIGDELYRRLADFNSKRNEYAHNLIGFNFENHDEGEEIINTTSSGLDLCLEVDELHKNALENI